MWGKPEKWYFEWRCLCFRNMFQGMRVSFWAQPLQGSSVFPNQGSGGSVARCSETLQTQNI